MDIIRTRQTKKGFTVVEIMIGLSIMFLLTGIIFSTFIATRKNQALILDTDTIVETLREARSQTLSSKTASQYGVHLASSAITLFSGASYSSGFSGNKVYKLSSSDTILSVTLLDGGTDVVFNRLSGTTGQSGTIVVSSPSSSRTKTITVYATGIVDVQ